jgi:hypothetical protein
MGRCEALDCRHRSVGIIRCWTVVGAIKKVKTLNAYDRKRRAVATLASIAFVLFVLGVAYLVAQ